MAEAAGAKLTAPKVIALIALLFIIKESVEYFYTVALGGDALNILYGILCLLFAAVIFLSLELVSLGKVKIPYFWWIMLIIGVLLVLFAYLSTALIVYPYFAGILVLMAAVIDLLSQKKPYKASKLVAIVGIGFGIYECIMLFAFPIVVSLFPYGNNIVCGIFGLIFAIILILTLIDKIDIKISYTWWVVLIVGFIFFAWVSPYSVFSGYPVTGYGGMILLIAFILILMAF